MCVTILLKGCMIKGQVYQKCASCPTTCSNPDLVCTAVCKPGCGCPTGQVIDKVNKKCVHPKQCPPKDCAVS